MNEPDNAANLDPDTQDLLSDAIEAAAELAIVSADRATFDPLEADGEGTGRNNLDLLLDVKVPVTVEVGRTQMSLDEVLDLVPGSVITLNKKAEEPVDLRVNGKLVARGEVVLVDDVYGIRITQIADKTSE